MMHVRLGERSYAIAVERSYRRLPSALKRLGLGPVGWVVSHRRLLNRHGSALLDGLRRAGWTLHTVTVPEAESSKSLAMAQRLIEQLSRRPLMRAPVLLAFGGGVVGDLTGFVAAIYRRGVPYIQLPTTLLAQVDSAIGGKVGVDLPQAKNFVGAFYQPRLVWNNLALLHTLPPRQRRSGLAEVIKYGVMADPELFDLVESRMADCLALEDRAVQMMVERACRIKAGVVGRDERETRDVRIRLNFGHTIGHALEAATGYARWTHGEAISIGMCAAASLAQELGLLSAGEARRLERVIRSAGLPVHAWGVRPHTILAALRYDKKFIHGRPRWVLPTRIGRVTVAEAVPETLVRRVLNRLLSRER